MLCHRPRNATTRRLRILIVLSLVLGAVELCAFPGEGDAGSPMVLTWRNTQIRDDSFFVGSWTSHETLLDVEHKIKIDFRMEDGEPVPSINGMDLTEGCVVPFTEKGYSTDTKTKKIYYAPGITVLRAGNCLYFTLIACTSSEHSPDSEDGELVKAIANVHTLPMAALVGYYNDTGRKANILAPGVSGSAGSGSPSGSGHVDQGASPASSEGSSAASEDAGSSGGASAGNPGAPQTSAGQAEPTATPAEPTPFDFTTAAKGTTFALDALYHQDKIPWRSDMSVWEQILGRIALSLAADELFGIGVFFDSWAICWDVQTDTQSCTFTRTHGGWGTYAPRTKRRTDPWPTHPHRLVSTTGPLVRPRFAPAPTPGPSTQSQSPPPTSTAAPGAVPPGATPSPNPPPSAAPPPGTSSSPTGSPPSSPPPSASPSTPTPQSSAPPGTSTITTPPPSATPQTGTPPGASTTTSPPPSGTPSGSSPPTTSPPPASQGTAPTPSPGTAAPEDTSSEEESSTDAADKSLLQRNLGKIRRLKEEACTKHCQASDDSYNEDYDQASENWDESLAAREELLGIVNALARDFSAGSPVRALLQQAADALSQAVEKYRTAVALGKNADREYQRGNYDEYERDFERANKRLEEVNELNRKAWELLDRVIEDVLGPGEADLSELESPCSCCE